ncbi:4Fe-4S binding protein [Clostridium omnivorum]|uniref:4Fe-4S binding protein n=1 Tax=Clostridium omnivorum TaxID=1604902 RepID=UPI00222F1F73|nr:4Fe-4S binding protein [Clostridium sp. E14]
MKRTLQIIVQTVFLILFILLFINTKIQMWMLILLLGILSSFLLGRIYCGWICPINTVIKVVTSIKKKLHIKSFKIPKFLSKPWVRYLVMGLFIAVFIFIRITGRNLPVLIHLFAMGILLTLFFPEELWHRYLCPYGTIMSFPASKARHSMKINADKCNNCGACRRVCPAKAVNKNIKGHEILKAHCLVCMECSTNCRQKAITYK